MAIRLEKTNVTHGVRIKSAYIAYDGDTPICVVVNFGPNRWSIGNIWMDGEGRLGAIDKAGKQTMFRTLIDDNARCYSPFVATAKSKDEAIAKIPEVSGQLLSYFKIKELYHAYTDWAETKNRQKKNEDERSRFFDGVQSLWQRQDLTDDERFALEYAHKTNDSIYIEALGSRS